MDYKEPSNAQGKRHPSQVWLMRNQSRRWLVREEISITTDSSGTMNDQSSLSVCSLDHKLQSLTCLNLTGDCKSQLNMYSNYEEISASSFNFEILFQCIYIFFIWTLAVFDMLVSYILYIFLIPGYRNTWHNFYIMAADLVHESSKKWIKKKNETRQPQWETYIHTVNIESYFRVTESY